ncbi:MAG: hypothetical protein GEU26_18425 [Nitrososphaeraceae archaeon]|nr:hypothetical protein [Nitrososphaeraceae archaeon]
MEKSNMNMKWFFNNQEWLISNFLDEFVAIDNEQLIDHSKNSKELLDKLKKNKQYTNSLLIQFVHGKNIKLM